MEKKLVDSVVAGVTERRKFSEEIRNYLLQPAGPVTISSTGYSDLVDGIKLKDITSNEQFELGITVLSVVAEKEVDFGEHEHDRQSQVIYVIAGKIADIQSGLTFKPGQSFLVPKSNSHSVRYFQGTQAVIVYMPRLNLV